MYEDVRQLNAAVNLCLQMEDLSSSLKLFEAYEGLEWVHPDRGRG
ncbi:MAG: hypothetical protein ACP5KE_03885 [Candidatus Methanodesulfokora sp.]|jgi:hypothetical protein